MAYFQESQGYPYPKQQGPPPTGFNSPYGQPPYPQGQGFGQPPYPQGQAFPPYGQPAYPPGQPIPPYGPSGQPIPPYGQAIPPYGQAMPTQYSTYDNDGPRGDSAMAFSEKTIRNGFIRKVYSILMVQLAVTAGIIFLFLYNEGTKRYVQRNPGLLLVALVVAFVCLICMACCESARRKTPGNFIFLGIFTLAEGFMLGVFSTVYSANEVLLAIAACSVVCFGLTIYAFQTKVDFTMAGGILFVAVLIFMVFGLIAMFFPKSRTFTLIYAIIGTLIFSIYLIYDTQLMIGGSHKYSISPEEYVFAALNLYVDIVNIFIYILTIIGAGRD